MKSLFNISKMFEQPVFDQLIVDVNKGSFMDQVIIDLEECNKEYIKLTKDLYTSLNEADSITDENDIFNKYHLEVSELIDQNIKSITELASMFSIRLENMATTCLSNLNDVEPTSLKPFSYRYREFTREEILSTKYPNVGMRSMYRNEFEFLSTLLQELGAYAKDKDKLSVIATVYNTFASKMKSKGKEDCIEYITGRCVDYDKSLPAIIFKKFRDDDYEDITMGTEEIYDAKYTLKNYSEAIDVVNTMANIMISDLNYIKNDIMETLFNIDKKTLKVKGGNVKLDEFSINQLQMFFKVKVNQLMQMFNIFNIAFSIKLDAMREYYEQLKDILDMAVFGSIDEKIDGATSDDNQDEDESNDDTDGDVEQDEDESNDEESEEDTDDDVEQDEDSGSDYSDDESNDEEDEDTDNDGIPNDSDPDDNSDAEVSEDFEDESNDEESEEDETETEETPVNTDDAEIKEMVREFNYEIYELGMLQENMDLMEHIILLNEDDDNKSKAKETKSSNKKSIFQRIKDIFINFLDKFNNKVKELRESKDVNELKSDEWKKIFANPDMDLLRKRKFSVITVVDMDFYEKIQTDIKSATNNLKADSENEKFDNIEEYVAERFPDLQSKAKDNKDKSVSFSNIITDSIFSVKEKTGGGYSFNDLPDEFKDVQKLYNTCVAMYDKSEEDVKEARKIIAKGDAISNAIFGKIKSSASTYRESDESLEDFFSVFLEADKDKTPNTTTPIEEKPKEVYAPGTDPKDSDKTPKDGDDNTKDTKPAEDSEETKAEKIADRFNSLNNTIMKFSIASLNGFTKVMAERIKFLKFYVSLAQNTPSKKTDDNKEETPKQDNNDSGEQRGV